MGKSRKVVVEGATIYQKDGGIDSYTFSIERYYNGVDLSGLSSFLKINYSDDSADKILLTQTVSTNTITLVWDIATTNTMVSGEAECQISMESSDAKTVYNSDVFKIEIKQSVSVDIFEVQSVPSAIQQLQTELNNKLNYVEDIIDGGIVTTVNGSDGDITITPASIGATTPTDVQNKINELVSGAKPVAQSVKATKDGDGNTISTTYLKIANAKSEEWCDVYTGTVTSNVTNYVTTINPKCKKVYVHIVIAGDTSSSSEWGKITVNTIINGTAKCIFSPTTAFLGKNANKKEVSFVVEMCGSFAKVRCLANCQSNQLSRDYVAVDGSVVGDYSAETIGTSIGQKYLTSLQFLISGQGHSFDVGTTFSFSTVKYNQ